MINFFYKSDNKISRSNGLDTLANVDQDKLLWVDLINPTVEEIALIENHFDFQFQSQAHIEEIESSSSYLESENLVFINSDFILNPSESMEVETVAFILWNGLLISKRKNKIKTLDEMNRKTQIYPKIFDSGYSVLVSLFEAQIDVDADLLESMAKRISRLSKSLNMERNLDEEILIKISKYLDYTMTFREIIIDMQRITSAMLKSKKFPENSTDKLRILIKDIGSLVDHTTFNFERLEYLQNTFLGLINIEQNKIIKIFTVAAVVFLPPTLIASIYGMNFDVMPELHHKFGYPLSLILMVLSVASTLFYFKKKKWL